MTLPTGTVLECSPDGVEDIEFLPASFSCRVFFPLGECLLCLLNQEVNRFLKPPLLNMFTVCLAFTKGDRVCVCVCVNVSIDRASFSLTMDQ